VEAVKTRIRTLVLLIQRMAGLTNEAQPLPYREYLQKEIQESLAKCIRELEKISIANYRTFIFAWEETIRFRDGYVIELKTYEDIALLLNVVEKKATITGDTVKKRISRTMKTIETCLTEKYG